MLAIAFDTLKLARKLENAGFPSKQAQDASAALAETFSEWQASINLATREDLQRVEVAFRHDLQKSEVALREDMQKLELGLRHDLQKSEVALHDDMKKLELALRGDMQKLEIDLRKEIANKAAETVRWVIGMSVAQAGLVIAVLKLHA